MVERLCLSLTQAYRKEGLGIASSIDRIIEITEPITLEKHDGGRSHFNGAGYRRDKD